MHAIGLNISHAPVLTLPQLSQRRNNSVVPHAFSHLHLTATHTSLTVYPSPGVSISTDVWRRASATSIRDVGYFLPKLIISNKIKIYFDGLGCTFYLDFEIKVTPHCAFGMIWYRCHGSTRQVGHLVIWVVCNASHLFWDIVAWSTSHGKMSGQERDITSFFVKKSLLNSWSVVKKM